MRRKISHNWSLEKTLPWILLIGGIIGYACAFIILFDKIQLLKNPGYIPACDLNPIISCGNIMESQQSNAFGFPNPFIGLGAFPVLAVIGGAMLAGATFKRWFWLGLQAGLVFALGFVHWLFYQSVYSIGALCPWCMVVWVVTITTFWYVTLYNIDKGHLRWPGSQANAGKAATKKSATTTASQSATTPQRLYAWIRRHHLDILVLWFLVIFALILKHFWYYYGRNF